MCVCVSEGEDHDEECIRRRFVCELRLRFCLTSPPDVPSARFVGVELKAQS